MVRLENPQLWTGFSSRPGFEPLAVCSSRPPKSIVCSTRSWRFQEPPTPLCLFLTKERFRLKDFTKVWLRPPAGILTASKASLKLCCLCRYRNSEQPTAHALQGRPDAAFSGYPARPSGEEQIHR